jgi:hypothetical protein
MEGSKKVYKLLKLTGKNIETDKGINKQALGYLEGFTKAAMREQQLDVASERAFAVFRMFYEKVFGRETGERYLEYWTNSISDAETQNGVEIGALDFSSFSNTGRPPTGWYRCFKDEDEKAVHPAK